MKHLLFSLYITLNIISCGSLKEDTDIVEQVTPLSKSPSVLKKTDVFTSTYIREILERSDMDLPLVVIFPSYNIIPKQLPLPDDPILRIIELKKRYYQYNDLHQSHFSDNEISAIFSDSEYYYLGSVRGGIFRYSIDTGDFLEIKIPFDSIVNQSITGIVKKGSELIITSFSGLYSYDLRKEILSRKIQNENNLKITSLSVGVDSILLGTANGRLLELRESVLVELLQIKNNIISAVFCTDDIIYVGTSQAGVYKYNRSSGESDAILFINSHLENEKISFITNFDEKFWLGAAGDGLLVFDEKTGKLLAEERDQWFLSTSQSENIIYFGTHGDGLLYYDRIKNEKKAWGIREGLSSLYIPSLFQANGKIYISTPDEGIVIISEEIHEQKL